jgi:lysophospholipase L1-like esterase
MSPLPSAALPAQNSPPQPTIPGPVLPQSSGPQSLSKHRPIDMTGQRVLLIGDSLGVGVGPVLERELRPLGIASFKNISVGGTNIMQWVVGRYQQCKDLDAALASYKPTIVFISLGTNDESSRSYIIMGKPFVLPYGPTFDVAKQRAPHVAKMREKLAGVKSIWLGPPISHPDKWPADRKFRDMIAGSWGEDYFNTEAVAPAKTGDKIHFTGTGNKTWASAIANWIRGG